MSKMDWEEPLRTGISNPRPTMRSYNEPIYREEISSTGYRHRVYLWKSTLTGTTMWSEHKPDMVLGHDWHNVYKVEED